MASRQVSSSRVCPNCGKKVGARGLGNHQRTCLLSAEKRQQNEEYEAGLEEAQHAATSAAGKTDLIIL